MVAKSESPGSMQSIRRESGVPDPALDGGTGPSVVVPRKALSRVAQSIVRWLLSLYALRRPLSILILVVVDTLALFAGFGLSSYLMGGDRWTGNVLHLAPILLTVWLAIFTAHRLYDRASNRRRSLRLVSAVLLSSGLLAVGGALYPELSLVPKTVLLGALFTLPLVGGMRLLYERGTQNLHEKKGGVLPS